MKTTYRILHVPVGQASQLVTLTYPGGLQASHGYDMWLRQEGIPLLLKVDPRTIKNLQLEATRVRGIYVIWSPRNYVPINQTLYCLIETRMVAVTGGFCVTGYEGWWDGLSDGEIEKYQGIFGKAL